MHVYQAQHDILRYIHFEMLILSICFPWNFLWHLCRLRNSRCLMILHYCVCLTKDSGFHESKSNASLSLSFNMYYSAFPIMYIVYETELK